MNRKYLLREIAVNDSIKASKRLWTEEIRMTNTQAWNYAVGMIKVDGLEPTKDFKEYIEKEKRGEVTMEDVKRYLDRKYKVKEG